MSTSESARSSGTDYGRQLRGRIEAATDEEALYHVWQEAARMAQRLRDERGVDFFNDWREGLLERVL